MISELKYYMKCWHVLEIYTDSRSALHHYVKEADGGLNFLHYSVYWTLATFKHSFLICLNIWAESGFTV